ncbi:PHP domain-containing protein [Candidatus Woesearchaeota archaeon]|nr:PHP domain-containing protein [Candidatus Woesearchaeota archaeon]
MAVSFFSFDGQVHVPPERLEETLRCALQRKLDAISFTDYNTTLTFDLLSENKDSHGKKILSSDWKIYPQEKNILLIKKNNKKIFVIKGEEVTSQQGHVLLWGIQKAVPPNLPLTTTLQKTFSQGGIAVFAHPFTSFFHGCGKENILAMKKRFPHQPLGVEQNAQVSSSWLSDNLRVKTFAKEQGLPCFGSSDLHGRYRQEHTKIGLLLHTKIPSKYITPQNLLPSFRKVMLHHPSSLQVHGIENNLSHVLFWNCCSLQKQPYHKLSSLFSGIKRVLFS